MLNEPKIRAAWLGAYRYLAGNQEGERAKSGAEVFAVHSAIVSKQYPFVNRRLGLRAMDLLKTQHLHPSDSPCFYRHLDASPHAMAGVSSSQLR